MEANSTFSYIYTISYDENTSKVSFLIASGTNISKTELLFSTGTNKSDSLLRVLGFSETDKEFTNSTALKSDFVVDMADGLDSLRCLSNLVGDNIVITRNNPCIKSWYPHVCRKEFQAISGAVSFIEI